MIDVPDNLFPPSDSFVNWTQFEKSGIDPAKSEMPVSGMIGGGHD